MKSSSSKMQMGLFLALVIFIFGIGYAIVKAPRIEEEESNTVTSMLGRINLEMQENTYVSQKQTPGDIVVQTLKIKPVAKGIGTYEIDALASIPSELEGKVQISLYKSLDESSISILDGKNAIVYDEITHEFRYEKTDKVIDNGVKRIFNGILQTEVNCLAQEEFKVVETQEGLVFEEEKKEYAKEYTYFIVYQYKNSSAPTIPFQVTISAKLINEKAPVSLTNLIWTSKQKDFNDDQAIDLSKENEANIKIEPSPDTAIIGDIKVEIKNNNGLSYTVNQTTKEITIQKNNCSTPQGPIIKINVEDISLDIGVKCAP